MQAAWITAIRCHACMRSRRLTELLLALGAAALPACTGVATGRGPEPLPGERATPRALWTESHAPGLQLQRHGQLEDASVSRIEDPLRRSAMRFAQGLVTENRRRMARGFGELRLGSYSMRECDAALSLRADERRAEARADQLDALGPTMLRGPLQDALRELPISRDAEVTLDELCRSHDPFRADRSDAASAEDRGRLAVRVRASDPASGLELGYRYRGFHALSSAERVRLRLDLAVAERTTARVAVAHAYAESQPDFRVEVGWEVDADTRVHVTIGNRIGPLPTPGPWPGSDHADETGAGVSFYVEQLF